jgi:phosphatidylserine decarboxylase
VTRVPDLASDSIHGLRPRRLLTELAGRIASAQAGAFTHWMIRRFCVRYRVDMREALQPDPGAYPSFNAFFTRALQAGSRPIAETPWVSPVDGAISQFGRIEGDQLFQAKGHHYSTAALLAGDTQAARRYDNGHFATLYLSPRDYHRVHMPCDGRLVQMVYVPGSLYSVNPATALRVPGLFARNERVICHFDSASGPFVLVLVGATIVGSMATVWHGVVNPPRPHTVRPWRYPEGQVSLGKGQEMGRFMLGSTVVMLFAPQALQFNPDWQPGRPVRMGEPMASRATDA